MRDGSTGKRWLKIATAGGVIFLGMAAAAIGFLNPLVTRYVEDDAFRVELEKETAKGICREHSMRRSKT